MPKKSVVLPLVEKLIKQITGIKEENVIESVVDSVSLALCDSDSEIPDRAAIQKNIDGLVLKFRVHGFSKFAEDFDKNVRAFVNNKEAFRESPDLPWNMLKLLLPLSWKPMEHAQQVAMGNASNADEAYEETQSNITEPFDWTAYLCEGNEKFKCEEDDSDSDWSQLTECEEEVEDSSTGIVIGPPISELDLDGLCLTHDVPKAIRTMPLQPVAYSYGSNPSSRTNFFASKMLEEELNYKQVSNIKLETDVANLKATSNHPLSTDNSKAFARSTNELASCGSSESCSDTKNASSNGSNGNNGSNASNGSKLLVNQDWVQVFAEGFKAKRHLDMLVPQSYLFAADEMKAYPSKPINRLDIEAEVTVLPEYFVLREVLWLFLSSVENRCFGLDKHNKFKPRPDFTIQDVNVEVLWDFLEKFCPYFDMIREFQLFRDDIYKETVGKAPPTTYKAYHYVVKQYIIKFKDNVSDIMNKVAKQENINTLLSVHRELQPSLSELEFIMNVHRKAVCDWRLKPNWFSAIRLLTVLYWSLMEQSFKPSRATILCDIFLKSFHAYATIIDMWLTQGVNTDFTNEFVVYRADSLENSMYDSWDGGFFIHPYKELLLRDIGLPPLSMLENVINEILLSCKSIYIVKKLDKLIKFARAGHSTECVLFQEFLSGLETGFTTYKKDRYSRPIEPHDREDSSPTEPVFVFTGKANPMAEYITDPFLRIAFKDFIEFEDNQELSHSNKPKKLPIDIDCDRIKWYTSSTNIMYEGIMEGVFESLVLDKYLGLGRMINTVMRDDVKLCHHLKTLRAVFMFESGDIMAVFSDLLSLKVKDEPFWLYSQYLTSHLSDYFEQRFQGSNHFRILVDAKFVDKDALKAIEGIELRYSVEWPLSLIINDSNLSLYNEIFRLLLRLKWTLTSLERLRFGDLCSSRRPSPRESLRIARWQTLRFWLLNAVSGIHYFTMGHVIDSFSAELDEFVKNANDFDLLIDAHNKYVRMVHQLCVNPFEDSKLLPAFGHLLTLSLCLVELWSQGSYAVLDKRLSEMEDMYCKIHTSIGLQLIEFTPKNSRIQIDSLISVFYYPLRPAIGARKATYL